MPDPLVVFAPGSMIPVQDALSRGFEPETVIPDTHPVASSIQPNSLRDSGPGDPARCGGDVFISANWHSIARAIEAFQEPGCSTVRSGVAEQDARVGIDAAVLRSFHPLNPTMTNRRRVHRKRRAIPSPMIQARSDTRWRLEDSVDAAPHSAVPIVPSDCDHRTLATSRPLNST